MKRVIGLSGVAGCGKDTAFSLLSSLNPNVRRFALADALKREIYPFVKELYSIDIFKCTREDKNLVRNILVEHGHIRRQRTNGTYWTSILTKEINDFLNISANNIAVVTDVRYCEYEQDELFWIKNVLGGGLIHISMVMEDGTISPPANAKESFNDPIIKANADLVIEWGKVKYLSDIQTSLLPYANKIQDFINSQD